MNLTRYPGKEKNEVRKAKEEERRERYQKTPQTAVSFSKCF